uniref:Uncharacterized protein n=1 Tax=Amphimedon queenslandica TaxID=400682 RepID=A0A1X7TH26_AMPQE
GSRTLMNLLNPSSSTILAGCRSVTSMFTNALSILIRLDDSSIMCLQAFSLLFLCILH